EVEQAMMRLLADRPLPPRAFLLVDRWFPDIYAYTHMESQDSALRADVKALCVDRLTQLSTWLLTHARQVRVLNLFVPVQFSKFRVPRSTKFRATGDRAAWERICVEHWASVVGSTT